MSLLLKLSSKVPKSVTSKFDGLQTNLAKVSKTSFEVYLGLIAFTVLVAGTSTFVISAVVLAGILPLFQAIGGAFILAVLVSLFSVSMYYLVAMTKVYSSARKIDSNLPLIANFMAVLANSGMPPERILRSLGNAGDEFGVGEEIRRAVGDVELRGMDLKGALRNASMRSSSRKL